MSVIDEFERLYELIRRVPHGTAPDAREVRAEALMLVAAAVQGNLTEKKPDFQRDSELSSYLTIQAQKWLQRRKQQQLSLMRNRHGS